MVHHHCDAGTVIMRADRFIPGEDQKNRVLVNTVLVRNAKLAVLVAMVAFFLGNSLMFIFGAAGAAALGMAEGMMNVLQSGN